MFGDRVVGERMQTTEVEPRVELLNIRKVVGVEVKERNTLESGRLKPKGGGPGVVDRQGGTIPERSLGERLGRFIKGKCAEFCPAVGNMNFLLHVSTKS